MMEIELGKEYRDTISGVKGIATARYEYLYGCVRIHLEWGAETELKSEIFDEQRLVAVETDKPPTPTATSGGFRPTPSR